MAAATTAKKAMAAKGTAAASSFGFSGAGFLTCYHLGVADCLLKHGRLLQKGDVPNNNIYGTTTTTTTTTATNSPILTGVSGGALVAAAVSIGISPQDGMNAVAEIVRRTRTVGGMMDHLKPGFSLIDQVEDMLLILTKDADDELVRRRINTIDPELGVVRLLRIGLTDSSYFPHQFRNPNSYLYVDDFENVQEILAACILSSYLPGLTGPVLETAPRNGAVRRATILLNKMLERGSVKNIYGIPVYQLKNPKTGRFWDGGLANTFPVIDTKTCLVTPFSGKFANHSISPSSSSSSTSSSASPLGRFQWERSCPDDLNHVELEISLKNLNTFRCTAFSSDYPILESWFENGHNDALRYLKAHSLESVYSIPTLSTTTTAAAPTITTTTHISGTQPTQTEIMAS